MFGRRLISFLHLIHQCTSSGCAAVGSHCTDLRQDRITNRMKERTPSGGFKSSYSAHFVSKAFHEALFDALRKCLSHGANHVFMHDESANRQLRVRNVEKTARTYLTLKQ